MRNRAEGSGPPVAIGIDLGTCFSRMAFWKDGDVLVIPNERGRLATPTVVAFTEHRVLVGEAAEDQAVENLENTIYAPQRLIGAKFENPWVQWHMRTWPSRIVRSDGDRPLLRVQEQGGQRLLRPEEVVTLLMDHLRRTAERYLGAKVVEAVITVPAQFGRHQREALVEACHAARLRVLDLVKCPTAAAVAFCHMNPSKCRRHLLVCDMGGSYFDFSLLSVEDGLLSERAVGTDYVDLDAALLRFCVRDMRERFTLDVSDEQHALHRLRTGCELAKRKLSQMNQASIEVKNVTEGVDYQASISRGHFEDFCGYDVEHLLDPIDWCLEDCGLSREDVEVVLVGGCARVPQVRRLIRAFFYGKPPHEVLRPDHAAVLGAAVFVALLSAGCGGGANGGAPLPAGLLRMRLRQVAAGGCAVAEAEAAAAAGVAAGMPSAPSHPADGADGDAAAGTRARAIAALPRSSEELEPAPCNEASGLQRPAAGRILRPASCQRSRSTAGMPASILPSLVPLQGPEPLAATPTQKAKQDAVVAEPSGLVVHHSF